MSDSLAIGAGEAGVIVGGRCRAAQRCSPGGLAAGLMVVLLAAVMVLRIVSTYSELSATTDEGHHLAYGLVFLEGREGVSQRGHPPLGKVAVALFPYLAGLRAPAGELPGRTIEESPDYWVTLSLARTGTLLFLPLLILAVFCWSRELHGPLAGVAGVIVLTSCPNILAHASLAAMDFACAATLTAAAWLCWRWLTSPSFPRLLVAVVVCGAALATKYSAVGYLPVIFGAMLVVSRWPQIRRRETWKVRRLLRLALGFSACVGAILLAVWACFGFRTETVLKPGNRPHRTVDRVLGPGSAAQMAVYDFLESTPAPLGGFVNGVRMIARHAGRGHTAYFGGTFRQFLLGETRADGGWWYYFPVAIAVKSTLPFLALMVLGAALFAMPWGRRLAPGSLAPAVAAAAILVVATRSDLNIGIRHVLPFFPIAAVVASALFARRGAAWVCPRPVVIIAGVLVAAHAASSFAAHPDYLPYFNELARGREHQVLGDSNLDWGQDLGRLGRFVREQGIDELAVAYLGGTEPPSVLVAGARGLGPGERPTGWVAISVSFLQGIVSGVEDDSRWYLSHAPVAKVGKSIWVYHFDEPSAGSPSWLPPSPDTEAL